MDGENVKDVVQMVLDFITEIGSAMIDTGFTLAIKRVYFLGIRNLILVTIFLVVFFVAFRLMKKYLTFWRQYQDRTIGNQEINTSLDEEEVECVMWVLGFTAAIVWLPIIMCFIDALDYFVNTEWNAVILIMQLVGR